jgi:hypothetical protein
MAIVYTYDLFDTGNPVNTNLTVLMQLAAGEELLNSWVICTNLSAVDVTVRVGVGNGPGPDAYLVYDFPIIANLFLNVFISGLGNENKIFIKTSSANDVDFALMGCMKTTTL